MGWKDDPILGAADAPAIDIRPGGGPPPRLAASENPYSAGRYPLGRVFTVGDKATFRETDILSGVEQRTYDLSVTRVDEEADRIEINNGILVTDRMGNYLKNDKAEFSVPQQFAPAEIFVGKKWQAVFRRNDYKSGPISVSFDFHISRREKIVVSAGEFNAFRLEGEGWSASGLRIERINWLVPGLNFAIKQERIARDSRGQFFATDRHELVSLRQQAIGL